MHQRARKVLARNLDFISFLSRLAGNKSALPCEETTSIAMNLGKETARRCFLLIPWYWQRNKTFDMPDLSFVRNSLTPNNRSTKQCFITMKQAFRKIKSKDNFFFYEIMHIIKEYYYRLLVLKRRGRSINSVHCQSGLTWNRKYLN